MDDLNGKKQNGFSSFELTAESRRFGMKVLRYILEGDNADPMIEKILGDSPALAIVRIPTFRIDLVPKFQSFFSEVILADCITFYERDNALIGTPRNPKNIGLSFTAADSGDFETLDFMNEQIFSGYRNHYSSNQRLKGFRPVDAYKEWTRSHLLTGSCKCFVASLDNCPCGFLNMQIDRNTSVIQLNGVMPEFRGRGVYRDIIRMGVKIIMETNSSVISVSTQVENIAVQRVWVTEGFFMVRSYFTLHLNM
jgi:predicted GNAT family acetyltransferase